ncbi:MAG: hypothetical protein LBB67_02925 [Oscillospiraceae bacterium]|jgi:hypothetical protein|nr:hypothetical protein [Oscillospiraceae bacterium]
MDTNELFSEVMGFIQPIVDWIQNFIETYVSGGFEIILQAVKNFDSIQSILDIFGGLV